MKGIVVGDGTGRVPQGPSPEAAANAGFWFGLLIAIPGWIDVLMLYSAPRWASIDWEFGTITSTFDALPLGTVGLVLAALGAVGSGRPVSLKLMALLSALLLLALGAAAVIFALDIPVVLRAVRPDMSSAVKVSMLKTSMTAATYLVVYASMTVFCWRRSRPVL